LNHQVDTVIVLSRINYGDSDRILTVLGQKYGKRRILAKGVRKSTSKLAGNVEILTKTHLDTVQTKDKDLFVLTGAKLIKFYEDIVKNIDDTTIVYGWAKYVGKISPDGQGQEYFDVLDLALYSINSQKMSPHIVDAWLMSKLIDISGHKINWHKLELEASASYDFDYESNSFIKSQSGPFGQDTLKFLKYLGNSGAPKEIVCSEDLQKSASKLLSEILKRVV